MADASVDSITLIWVRIRNNKRQKKSTWTWPAVTSFKPPFPLRSC